MTSDVITTSMTSSRRLKFLMVKRRGALGCAWMAVIPLLLFVLCQLYQLQLMPHHQLHSPSFQSSLDFLMSRLYLKSTNTSQSLFNPQDRSASRLYDLERKVTEDYLYVQLALAATSRSLYHTAHEGSELADPGSLKKLRTFQPLLTPREKAHLLYLLEIFSNVCRSHNLDFFLLGDSLLGSVRHHGLVPWRDVSITVGMRQEQQGVLREVLGGKEEEEGVTLMWPDPHSWSLRLRDVRPDPPSLSRMTYILIQFFQKNGTHVWADSWNKRLFTADVRRVFPLGLRPFEGQMLPVPCDVMSVLSPRDVQQCRVVMEDLQEMEFRDAGVLSCDALSHVFPFVTRRLAMTSQSVLEQVTVNGTLLSTALVDGVCHERSPPHFGKGTGLANSLGKT